MSSPALIVKQCTSGPTPGLLSVSNTHVKWTPNKAAPSLVLDLAVSTISGERERPRQKILDVGVPLGTFTDRLVPVCRSAIRRRDALPPPRDRHRP